MQSPYRYNESKRPQMTSNDLKTSQLSSSTQSSSQTKRKRKSKNNVEGGCSNNNVDAQSSIDPNRRFDSQNENKSGKDLVFDADEHLPSFYDG